MKTTFRKGCLVRTKPTSAQKRFSINFGVTVSCSATWENEFGDSGSRIPIGAFGFVIDAQEYDFPFLQKERSLYCCKVCFPAYDAIHYVLPEALEVL